MHTHSIAPLAPSAADVIRTQGPAAALELAIAAWLDSKLGRTGSTRTRDAYAATLADAQAALASVGLELVSEPFAVALALQGWARSSRRAGRTVRPATVAQRLAVLSSFYAFALRRGLLPLTVNPADMVERPRVESYAEARTVSPDRLRGALSRLRREARSGDVQALRDIAMLRVALTTGRRAAELAGLRWADVDVSPAGAVTLNITRAKGGKVMRDMLAHSVAQDVLNWLRVHYGPTLEGIAPDAAVWPALRGGGRTGRARIGSPISAAGIAEITERRLGVNPHQLRATFAQTMHYQAGAAVADVQARLGHSSLSTTGRYLAQIARAYNPHADRIAELCDGTAD